MNAYGERQTSGHDWTGVALPFLSAHGTATYQDHETRMTDFAAEHEAVLREIRKSYVFPPDASVTLFLTEHRSISQLLLEAVPHLDACFGQDAVFHLRAPIDESGFQTLYAVAIWPGSVGCVRDALAAFDHWWTPQSGRARGHLTFTYELI
jgi:hypothetical protein